MTNEDRAEVMLSVIAVFLHFRRYDLIKLTLLAGLKATADEASVKGQ